MTHCWAQDKRRRAPGLESNFERLPPQKSQEWLVRPGSMSREEEEEADLQSLYARASTGRWSRPPTNRQEA